jgi:hypothetical protein
MEAVMRALATAVPDTEMVAVLHTIEGQPAVGAIRDGVLHLVSASMIQGDDRPFGAVRLLAIDSEKSYMEVAVRLHFSDSTVWREAHWRFNFPGTELRFRTYQALEGDSREIPEDFALALAGPLGFEFPDDVEPQALTHPSY